MKSIVRLLRRLQFPQQVHDLRPCRDVEGGHGFVGDDEGRIGAYRSRDHRALALAAGHFMRIAA